MVIVVRGVLGCGVGGRRWRDRVSSGWMVVVRGRVWGMGMVLGGLAGGVGGDGVVKGMDEVWGRGL